MHNDDDLTDQEYQTIGKYLDGRLNAEELIEFEFRLKQEPSFREHVEVLRDIWDKAPMTLEDPDLDVPKALDRVEKRIQSRSKITSKEKQRWITAPLKIAASIALLLAMSVGFWLSRPDFITAYHGDRPTELPDGTLVYLSEGSTFRFPKKFEGGLREGSLSGKAYFDVKSDPKRPFVIRGHGSSLTVLGTEFDLEMDSVKTAVQVTEGTIRLQTDDKGIDLQLSAGESAAIDLESNSLMTRTIASPLAGAWATGVLTFNKVPLSELITSLNKYFSSHIVLEGNALNDCTITTRFDQPAMSEVIEEISMLLSLEVIREGEKIILSGEGCKPE